MNRAIFHGEVGQWEEYAHDVRRQVTAEEVRRVRMPALWATVATWAGRESPNPDECALAVKQHRGERFDALSCKLDSFPR